MTAMDGIPSLVHILAYPSYEPVASRVPSLCRTEAKHLCYSSVLSLGKKTRDERMPKLTFQSSEVTSLLLGTSWPPSLMQWRSTSWVELELVFSLRFQMRAVESPELNSKHREVRMQNEENLHFLSDRPFIFVTVKMFLNK